MDAALADELERRTIEYVGSDGRPVTLTLATLIARKRALEMAYNQNDCVKRRWGAAATDECQRFAPKEQRQWMEELRHWFRDRKRPLTDQRASSALVRRSTPS